MDLPAIVKLLGGLVAAIGGPAILLRIGQALFPDHSVQIRRELVENVELYSKLPEESQAKSLMLGAINDDAARLVLWARHERRNPGFITIGLIFSLLGAVCGYFALSGLPWWWSIPLGIGAAILGAGGLIGAVQGAKKGLRDEAGNLIDPKKVASEGGDTSGAPSAPDGLGA